MKPLVYLSFLFIIILFSCQTKPYNIYDKLILGEWKYIKTQKLSKPQDKDGEVMPPTPIDLERKSGYIFFEDGSCVNKEGYFTKIKDTKSNEENLIYLGPDTKYKITHDTLKIFNLNNRKWQSRKIYSITQDTLIFQNNTSAFAKYERIKSIEGKIDLFDNVVISSSGCLGSCPRNDILINKNEKSIYHGENFNTKNGYFESDISNKGFTEIETGFGKSNFSKLSDRYICDGTDQNEVSVTFIKENRIIKTILDCGYNSPSEFTWAYIPTIFLYQKLTLNTIKKIPIYLKIEYLKFENRNMICDMTMSESFYLWTLLLKGSFVNTSFNSGYNLKYFENKILKNIETNGRYYKFSLQSGKNITIDIGYDFIVENNFLKRFRKKNKDD